MAPPRSDPVDELLVMDAQNGDGRAMEELVQRWQRRFWRCAYRILGDVDAAWDVTQQTWLAIIEGLSRLNDPARFPPWGYRIVTNKAIDSLKARKRTYLLDEESTEGPQREDRMGGALRELLDRLDPDKKAVLVLRYIEMFTICEIGELLQVPEGTVKSRLYHAREELRKLWREEFGERS